METVDDVIKHELLRTISPSIGQNVNKKEKLKIRNDQKTRKRKWKPYHKMSWAERQRLAKKETKRANRTRKKMFEQGHVLAPYNTTQFLMDDHNTHQSRDDVINDSTDEYLSEEDYLQKQFTEDYENIHSERLNGMSKGELVQEYMLLEDKIEEMSKKLREIKNCCVENGTKNHIYDDDDDTLQEKIGVFRTEIENLRNDNDRLRSENDELNYMIREKSNVVP